MKKYNLTFWQSLSLFFERKHTHSFTKLIDLGGTHFLQCNHEGCKEVIKAVNRPCASCGKINPKPPDQPWPFTCDRCGATSI